MKQTRLWRLATATVATSALLMTMTGGVATAQDPSDFEDTVRELLEGDDDGDDGENGDGPTGTPLDEIIALLDPDELAALCEDAPEEFQELCDAFEGGDNGEAPEEQDPEIRDGEGGEGDIPDSGVGGFIGTAEATGLVVGVGLPAELAEGLEPLLDGLGIRDDETGGIRISVAETQAELQRAAGGDDVDGLARALATNLLLASEGDPGACVGSDTVELPPDQDVPLLRIDVVSIDCEQDDERAFAGAQVAGVDISLAGLIEAGFPEDIRDGIDEVLAPLNDELLTQLNDGCDDTLGAVLDELLPGSESCEALELQIRNPFDVDVPLLAVDGLASTSEVTAGDDDVTADAQATLASVNVAGLVCVGTDGGDPLSHVAGVTTDGETGTTSASAADASRLCENDASILRLIDGADALGSIELFETNITNLADGQLEELFEGIEALFEAIGLTIVTAGNPYEQVEGAGAVAGVTPLTVVGVAPFGEIPGLDEFLGDLEVSVAAMEVEAAVNTEPDDPRIPAEETPTEPSEPAEPARDLPKTGASAAGLLGLAALGAAAALRRRED
jgi:hypothetical protein